MEMSMYEEDRMFFGVELGEIKKSMLLQESRKIVFEFVVDVEYKDRFLQLVHNLSVPEFGIDVNLKDIWMKLYHRNHLIRFRIKASGPESNLKRWEGNIKQVLDFLNGENCLTYIKTKTVEQGN